MKRLFAERRAKELISKTLKSTSGEWGIYIKNISANFEIKHNANVQFSSASLIKLPILASTMMAVADGELNLSSKITVDNKFATDEEKSGSGIILHLLSPIELTLYDLCYFMIVVSDNYATDLIIDMVGMERINVNLKRIGLERTSLSSKISHYMELTGKNLTTPSEIGYLLELIATEKLPYSQVMYNILSRQVYNNRIPSLLPFEDIENDRLVIAHKTGTIHGIAHDAGIIRFLDKQYIICLLTKNQKEISRTSHKMAHLSQKIFTLFMSCED